MSSVAGYPIKIDKEPDKVNPLPLLPTTPSSERSTGPLVLMGGLPLEQDHFQKSEDCSNLNVAMQKK